MIVIRFDTWCECQTKKHYYTRYRIKGYKWTPFCRKETRQKHIERLSKKHPENRAYYEMLYGELL